MAVGGFNCPWCRAYNAKGDVTCFRCGKPLTSPGIAGIIRSIREQEYLGTKLLAGVSIAIFGLELAMSGGLSGGLFRGMPTSVWVRFGGLAFGLEHHEPYRYLSACFVHLGILHVVFNMMALGELGRATEDTIGTSRLIIGYVLTGIVGFVVSDWWYGMQMTAGASGAVFGIDGLVLAGMAVRRDDRWKGMLVRTLIQSVVFFYMIRTNQAAHLGGLVAGLILGVLFGLESRPWKNAIWVNALAGACLVAIAASVVLPHTSPTWKMIAARERAMRGE